MTPRAPGHWSAAPVEWPALAPGDVHLWRVALDVADPVAEELLDPGELARAAAFRFPLDRERYTTAHAAVRRILGGYVGVPPRAIAFARGTAGKPSVVGRAPHFNLAHSEDVALVAVADRDVGVDVECIRAAGADVAIANQFFSPAEAAGLRALSGVARTRAFFGLWTAKEAFVKACGAGLRLDLAGFTVAFEGGDAALLSRDGSQPLTEWALAPLDAGPGFAAALVVAAPLGAVRCWRWRPQPMRATA